MFFLTPLWRSIKIGVTIGLIASGVGTGAGGIYVITTAGGKILGGLLLASGIIQTIGAAFLGGSNSKELQIFKQKIEELEQMLKDLGIQIDDFRGENEKLRTERLEFTKERHHLEENVNYLAETEQKIEHENDKLKLLADENKKQLMQLTKTNEDYKVKLQKVVELADKTELENDKLLNNVQDLALVKQQLEYENATYQETTIRMTQQMDKLTELKSEFEYRNTELQTLFAQEKENRKEGEQQISNLKEQLEKFIGLYGNMKDLVKNLVSAGDLYQDFADTIGIEVGELENATGDVNTAVDRMNNMLNRLNQEMTDGDFGEIDTDGDGTISQTEWNKHFAFLKQTDTDTHTQTGDGNDKDDLFDIV